MSCAIGLWLLGSLPSNAQDVCFDEATAGRMVVELERIPNLQRQLQLQESISLELTYQKDTLLETVRLQKEQVTLAQETIAAQKQVAEVAEKNCEARVEAAQPSFWHQLGTHTGAFGVGAVIAAVLVLLL